MAGGQRKQILHGLRNFLCGVLIGAGAILPGVSGGVLAVIFDIYRPMMEVLTHPRRALPKYWSWIPPLVLGWCAGFLGFAKGIALMMEVSSAAATWLFMGLIVGTVPALFREAGQKGRGAGAWISLGLCFAATLGGLYYAGHIAGVHMETDFWGCSLCGLLWGMSVVIPGLTSASVLMALDLYQPMLDGLSALDWRLLIPTIPVMLGTIALLARLMSWFFRRWYAPACHGILGIVLAATVVIVPLHYAGVWEILLSIGRCAGGFALAFFLSRLEQKIQPEA